MKTDNYCPVCSNHCSKDSLRCHRGQHYFAAENLTDDSSFECGSADGKEAIDYQLAKYLGSCGRMMKHRIGGGKGSQQRILMMLKHGAISQRQMQEMLEIKSASLSEVLAKVEGEGLIKREKNQQDKRQIDLSLTEQGEQCALEAHKAHHDQCQQMFACLSDEEKQQLLALLTKLLDNWHDEPCADFQSGHYHGHKDCDGERCHRNWHRGYHHGFAHRGDEF